MVFVISLVVLLAELTTLVLASSLISFRSCSILFKPEFSVKRRGVLDFVSCLSPERVISSVSKLSF